MTVSVQKQFDFAKYIQKDLEDYNRLIVYFNNKLPQPNTQPNTVSETLINIILQVKTAFNCANLMDISSNTCYINIYDNYVKKIQKSAYIKQNRVCALRMLGQSKSNLFGWSDQEDGDALDKYMSQQNIEKYRHNIIDLHDIPAIPNVQLCKESIDVITQCTNLCKDTYLNESYIDYKIKLDAVTCFIIREYVATSRINIMLMCEFNEEKRILSDKLEKLENYINGVNYIIANIANA
jgi:hypothetical protein